MRPDPYKRARSRQYKAKHGIFDHKNASDQSKYSQTSIMGEKIGEESDNISITSDGTF